MVSNGEWLVNMPGVFQVIILLFMATLPENYIQIIKSIFVTFVNHVICWLREDDTVESVDLLMISSLFIRLIRLSSIYFFWVHSFMEVKATTITSKIIECT